MMLFLHSWVSTVSSSFSLVTVGKLYLTLVISRALGNEFIASISILARAWCSINHALRDRQVGTVLN